VKITITIRGVNGTGATTFDAQYWDSMIAISRVLALHDALRQFACGKPFDVLSAIRHD